MNVENSRELDNNININNSKEKLGYKEIINKLGIDNSNKYLEEEEIKEIYESMYCNQNGFVKSKYTAARGNQLLNKFKKLKDVYKTIKELKNLNPQEIRQCFAEHRCLTVLLFHILCNRLTIDKYTNTSGLYKADELLTSSELCKIEEAARKYKYRDGTNKGIIRYLIRIMLIYNKNLNEIIPSDIYDCYRDRDDDANATFNVLKTLGYFNENEHYKVNNKGVKYKKESNINIEFSYGHYIEIYDEYCISLEKQVGSKGNKSSKKRVALQFFNWLSANNIFINISELKFSIIEEFVSWIKTYCSFVTHKKYSKNTINSVLSGLGMFLKFIINKNYVSVEFTKDCKDMFEYSYKNVPIELFHDIVCIDERKKIEQVIMSYLEHMGFPAAPDMLRLAYFCAIRPIELTTLRFNCLVGDKNNPSLHLHKTKNGDERFIPLVKDAFDIVKKYRVINKKSLPIYADYDSLNEQRLFCYRNRLLDASSLNNIFKKLIIENNIVNENNKAKYSLYILRKLRITIWIEAGLSLRTIGELAGHRDIESQNAYYVGKELIMENALKSYMQLYKNFTDILQSENSYEYKPEIDVCEQHDYLEELQKTLLEIDSKSIFDVATKMAYKDYPELFFPLMNGKCGASYEEGPDFKCEVMEFPCLNCIDLIDSENYINQFDEYLLSLYNSRKMHIKNDLEGLVTRDEVIINKLSLFYQNNFNLNDQEVIERFKFIEEKTITKRGRKKGIKNGY